jgi:hypothetical protein
VGKIGMDLDGCVVNFIVGAQLLAREMFGVEIGEATEWNWLNQTLHESQQQALWEYVTASKVFWRELPPTPLGIDLLEALKTRVESHDDEVYFITSRPGYRVKEQSEIWLTMHGFAQPTVLCVDRPKESKGAIAKGLGLRWMFDDALHNCTAVIQASPQTAMVLVKAPYNQPCELVADQFQQATPLQVLGIVEEMP